MYIISKGRWESRLTSKALEKMSVPYLIAIEPQEYDEYAKVIDPKKILVAPFSNLGQGSIPIRNFVWEHAISLGAKRHWVLDDNIRDFTRLNRNMKPRCKNGTIFRCAEHFVDRYENVAMAGFQYFMFTPRKTAHPAFTLNTRIYSCIMLKNDIPYRWRGRYNEDTDLSLRILKDGLCTVLFYAFVANKMPTLTMKGGNMEILYKDEDSRLRMAESLVAQHPDVTRIYRRWGRWQHLVDYSSFQKRNSLKRRADYCYTSAVKNFNMQLEYTDEPNPDQRPERPRPKVKKRSAVVISEQQKPLEPAVADCRSSLPELGQFDSLGFDTETTTERSLFDRKIVGLSYFLPNGDKGYVPIRHPGGGNYDEEVVKRWVKNELRDKVLIGANSKYERHMTLNWGVDLEEQGCYMRDVFHMAALLNEKRYKLNLSLLMSEEFPEIQRIDADHSQIYRMPAAQASAIAIEDAEMAFKLNGVYEPKIEAEGLERVLQLEDDLIYATCEMERNGVYIDIEKLVRWQSEIKAEIESRLTQISKESGFQVDTGSWKSLQRLFEQLKIKYPRTNPTSTHPDGCPSFSEEFLEKISHPMVKMVTECRQMASYKAKFFDAYLERLNGGDKLFYSLHQLRGDEGGTITGRYSSSQSKDGEGINAQQVARKDKQPKILQRWDVRELFIPPPGRKWFKADAAQIELRFLVHYAALNGKRRLAEAYKSNPWIDFHMLMVEWTGLARTFAKNVTFAKQYGAGVDKIAYMCNVSNVEGQRISDQYDRQFGEASWLLNMATRQAERVGYVRTLLGRRRRFSPGDRMYSAWNAIVQGGAADINKIKMLELYRNRKRLDLTLRLTVHDEADGDVPGEYVVPFIAQQLNTQSVPMEVPILWECAAADNWSQCDEV